MSAPAPVAARHRLGPAALDPACPMSASSRPPGALHLSDVDRLRCPEGGGCLRFDGRAPGGWLEEGRLLRADGGEPWAVRRGLPWLYREAQVRGPDRLMRHFYDGLPRLHDPAVKYTLPLFQTGGTERALRDGTFARIDLGALKPRPDGQPLRILEVGVGAGANLAFIYRDLPLGLPVEVWGLDLSAGMMAVARRKLARQPAWQVRLLAGDAHRLPFPDHFFDRVFHVGGIGGFNDPAAALAEMGRVAVPGTPIVVVDERLDPARRHRLGHRLLFRAITFYDEDPRAPVAELPAQAVDVHDEQVSRFYYCLSFKMPASSGG